MSVHARRQRLVDGDGPARRFDALVREHHRPVYAHVRMVYPSCDVDAVVNLAFARLWEHLDHVPDHAVRTWLRAVVRHEVLNEWKLERRRFALGDRLAQLDHGGKSGLSDIESRIELQTVMSALATLAPIDREVLIMNAVEELSTEDLAAILGIRPTAAKVRLSRARGRLREAVERMDVLIAGVGQ